MKLTVEILGAHQLRFPSKDTCYPYAHIEWEGSVYATEVAEQTVSPTWERGSFVLPFQEHHRGATLTISVSTRDSTTQEQLLLGSAVVDLYAALPPTEAAAVTVGYDPARLFEDTLPLVDVRGAVGFVHVRLALRPDGKEVEGKSGVSAAWTRGIPAEERRKPVPPIVSPEAGLSLILEVIEGREIVGPDGKHPRNPYCFFFCGAQAFATSPATRGRGKTSPEWHDPPFQLEIQDASDLVPLLALDIEDFDAETGMDLGPIGTTASIDLCTLPLNEQSTVELALGPDGFLVIKAGLYGDEAVYRKYIHRAKKQRRRDVGAVTAAQGLEEQRTVAAEAARLERAESEGTEYWGGKEAAVSERGGSWDDFEPEPLGTPPEEPTAPQLLRRVQSRVRETPTARRQRASVAMGTDVIAGEYDFGAVPPPAQPFAEGLAELPTPVPIAVSQPSIEGPAPPRGVVAPERRPLLVVEERRPTIIEVEPTLPSYRGIGPEPFLTATSEERPWPGKRERLAPAPIHVPASAEPQRISRPTGEVRGVSAAGVSRPSVRIAADQLPQPTEGPPEIQESFVVSRVHSLFPETDLEAVQSAVKRAVSFAPPTAVIDQTLEYLTQSSLRPPSTMEPTEGQQRKRALLIACDYTTVRLPVEPLKGSDADLRAARTLAIDQMGVPDQPGYLGVLMALRRAAILEGLVWLATDVRPGDILLLYFSGYRTVDPTNLDSVMLSEDGSDITKHDMMARLHATLPAGCRLTCLFDYYQNRRAPDDVSHRHIERDPLKAPYQYDAARNAWHAAQESSVPFPADIRTMSLRADVGHEAVPKAAPLALSLASVLSQQTAAPSGDLRPKDLADRLEATAQLRGFRNPRTVLSASQPLDPDQPFGLTDIVAPAASPGRRPPAKVKGAIAAEAAPPPASAVATPQSMRAHHHHVVTTAVARRAISQPRLVVQRPVPVHHHHQLVLVRRPPPPPAQYPQHHHQIITAIRQFPPAP